MLLGLAIGDALGNPTESSLPGARFSEYGEIRDYVANRHAEGRAVGLPSDDSQLAFWTLERLLEDGGLDPERLADTFASRRIFGIGQAVRGFVRARKEGRRWYEAGEHSAGNGAVMRIAPVILPHLRAPSSALWEDAVVAGAITHNDASSIAACVAMTGILWELVGAPRAPEPIWWVDAYCSRARVLEGDVALTPRFQALAQTFRGPVWHLVDTRVREAVRGQLPVLEACERWYSGAFLLETIPSALYILARHGDDPEEAIVRAVNDTKDNDTIAAIVGAAVGALHGAEALPERWKKGLLGRTREDDDGRVFHLIAAAKERWAPLS
ncbi:ADP-ribosylglycohydrolase family protein [bacterium]|nr:ADP-ribosylglycohydrolase family protein [bacterium]